MTRLLISRSPTCGKHTLDPCQHVFGSLQGFIDVGLGYVRPRAGIAGLYRIGGEKSGLSDGFRQYETAFLSQLQERFNVMGQREFNVSGEQRGLHRLFGRLLGVKTYLFTPDEGIAGS